MFSTKWRTSPRQHGVTIERDVAIPVRDGVTLDSDIFRPDAEGKFPALLAVHAYSKAAQSAQMLPEGFSYARGFIETGDFNFYVRRGYALAIVNITGTYKSGGIFNNIDPQSIQTVIQVLKQRVSRHLRRKKRPPAGQLNLNFASGDDSLPRFWQRRFYDFNVWSLK
jgi:hypothetical protein